MTPPRLESPRLTLRPVEPHDIAPLAAIINEPAVAEWWGDRDTAYVQDEIVGDTETIVWAIEAAGAVVGLVQAWEEKDADYRHAGIDLFLAANAQGRGLGVEAVRLVARHLIDERGHHRITIDPAAANTRAIRAYEKVGFRPVGVMRQYERGPDGTWRDGLLMDLLAGELGDA